MKALYYCNRHDDDRLYIVLVLQQIECGKDTVCYNVNADKFTE